MRITFHITDECNMACTYCYEHKHHHVIKLSYAKALIDEIINFLLHTTQSYLYGYLNCETYSHIELDFIGGEITLYMNIVQGICDYFFDAFNAAGLTEITDKATIILETNGTTYFNDDVQSFLNKYGKITEFPITTDGCKECHDLHRRYVDGGRTFDDVDHALRDYISKYSIPKSKMTFTPDTLKYITESCQYLHTLGYTKPRFSIDGTGQLTIPQTEEYYQELIKLSDWIIDNRIEMLPSIFSVSYASHDITANCGMGGNQIAIDSYGNLYNCFHFSCIELQEKSKPIGNIFDKKIDMEFVYYFLSHMNSHNNPACKDCPIRTNCEECPAQNYKVYGEWFKSFNDCGATMAQAKAQKYFLQRAKDTAYPYFEEELAKIENCYTDDFEYRLYKEGRM